ncbi:MAG: adenylosuccinate synthase [Anaerolineae bacterium]|nr:MAG: adenylosuccinate synthase [Anaerolineae bacterium]
MPLDIIVGAQWGDEGKGRMVDLFASGAAVVARWGGGDNAGHTVTVGDTVFKLHLIPSGIIHPHTIGVMGNGMVINPETLLAEMAKLEELGVPVPPERLRISLNAHLITPAHRALDAAQEQQRAGGKIGTTLRGIGPAYVDKAARRGLRVGDMLDEEDLADKVKAHVENTNLQLTALYNAEPLDPDEVAAQFAEYARQLKPYIADTSVYLHQVLADGKRVLGEGAQGTLLDLDHGTYPYVTSSHPIAPAALVGLGLGFNAVGEVVGVTKVFQTRVGEGGFPTEQDGAVAERLRGTGENPWDEFGTTTGRPRRVGWLDLVLLRYAVRVNGLTRLALTKLDILSGLKPLKICVAYEGGGRTHRELPLGLRGLEDFKPVYQELPGWDEDVRAVRTWADLPQAARDYIHLIEEQSRVAVGWVSVGPERDQLVARG